uniref:Long form D7 salivary protein n=1 Tax=Anopheles atroparvus TaxID=41427 RepID=A0AAG5D9Q7_ANOAO
MSHTRAVVLAVACLCLILVQVEGAWNALDPEQMRFIHSRCFEDNLPAGPKRALYASKWIKWELEPNDETTHCFAKCVLEGIQLYDSKSKKFRSKRITIQHEAYKTFTGANDDEVAKYKQAVAALRVGSGSCSDVFNTYLPVHKQFHDVSQLVYLSVSAVAAKIYEADPNVKRKGESFAEYCAKRAWDEKTKGDACKARKYELTGSNELKAAIDCIFRGFRYINENGFNPDEIVRDFKLINKPELEPQVRSVLSKCAGEKAYEYYSCLLQSNVKEDFKHAFDFRELRSVDYSYLVKGNVYDPAKLKEEMAKADAKVC